jgi:poly(A) polymerase Pap1
MGYLGGISVHVMVTRICQLHPEASPEDLVFHFFTLYSRWSWLTNSVSIITDSPIPYKTQGGPKVREISRVKNEVN